MTAAASPGATTSSSSSVNHRLNIFGHLDLSASGDERFAQSGNAGVLDLVAALGWVREHAARFGGDPGNVTIFGQSGGGGKVSALLAMPGAKGLFHKAIIQSGAGVRFAERERTARLAEAVLKQLETRPQPTRRPAGAADRAPDGSHRPGAEDPAAAAPCAARPLQFRTGDRRPGAAGPSLRSGRVGLVGRHPVLIGGTKSEFAIYLAPDDAVWNRTLSEDELRKRIAAVAGDATDGLVAYYKRRDPAATPSDLLIAALTAANFQVRSTLLAERKVARGKAAVWMYRFDWETPAFGGRLKSPHSMDVPFVFDTLDVIGEPHRKPGAQDLADRVSTTWASFARNGDPSNKSIPAWPAYTADKRTTMLFNDECQVAGDPDGEVRPLWSKIATS